jgi:hypothetical protein
VYSFGGNVSLMWSDFLLPVLGMKILNFSLAIYNDLGVVCDLRHFQMLQPCLTRIGRPPATYFLIHSTG